ncbi:MAG TPA: hypothetical protein HA226_01855 [Nanoarchaeota archaeon]|nr:hypothetical protein [Nanoarchaeota archaeon]
MVFSFFKKRRDDEAHQKIEKLHSALKDSFVNVKKDMSKLGDWQSIIQKDVDMRHKDHSLKIKDFDRRLIILESQLGSFIDYYEEKPKYNSNLSRKSQEIKEEFEEATLIDDQIINDSLKALTITHKKMFATLFQLQKQLGTNKVSYKSLASVLYRDRGYAEVRSTLSQYISFLVDHGLVEKVRSGKESYVTITELGFDVLDTMNKFQNNDLELKKREFRKGYK